MSLILYALVTEPCIQTVKHSPRTWAATLAKPVLSSCSPSFQRCCCRSRSIFIRMTTCEEESNFPVTQPPVQVTMYHPPCVTCQYLTGALRRAKYHCSTVPANTAQEAASSGGLLSWGSTTHSTTRCKVESRHLPLGRTQNLLRKLQAPKSGFLVLTTVLWLG